MSGAIEPGSAIAGNAVRCLAALVLVIPLAGVSAGGANAEKPSRKPASSPTDVNALVAEQRARARELYGFERWPRPAREVLRRGVDLEKLRVAGQPPAWIRVGLPPGGTTRLWRDADAGFSVRLTIDVLGSRRRAQEGLLDFLALGTQGYLERLNEPDVGDIAFVDRRGANVAFARDNVNVVIRSSDNSRAGLTRVLSLARQVDQLVQKAEPLVRGRPLRGPTIQALALMPEQPRVGRPAEIRVEAIGEGPLRYAFRATGGTILHGAEARVFYQPREPGRQTVTVIAGDRRGVLTTRTLEVDVRR